MIRAYICKIQKSSRRDSCIALPETLKMNIENLNTDPKMGTPIALEIRETSLQNVITSIRRMTIHRSCEFLSQN